MRSAPLSCATRRFSAKRSSSLSPRCLRQWLRSERSCGKTCWKNSGEVLEIRTIDPAIAHLFVQAENLFEQQEPDRKRARDAGSTLVAVERRNLPLEPLQVELVHVVAQGVLICSRPTKRALVPFLLLQRTPSWLPAFALLWLMSLNAR